MQIFQLIFWDGERHFDCMVLTYGAKTILVQYFEISLSVICS